VYHQKHLIVLYSLSLVCIIRLNQQQQSPTFWIINALVIATLVAAASLGVYCGTGNCKSNSGGTASTPTTAAAAAAAAAAIKVACDFLELSTVNGACQATTSSTGSQTDTTIHSVRVGKSDTTHVIGLVLQFTNGLHSV
jgi:hypothetical protein